MNRSIIISTAHRAWPRTLLVSALCLTMGSVVYAQTRSQRSSTRRPATASSDRDSQSTSAGSVAPEYSAPDADYAVTGLLSRTSTETDGIDANIPWGAGLTRRLWQNRMTAPDPNEDAESRAALNSLIRQVRSVRFEEDDTGPTFSVAAEPATGADPMPVPWPQQTPQPAPSEPMRTPTAPSEPDPNLAPDTFRKLEGVLNDPNQIQDPLEMAELLFLSGRQTEAAVFYEKALARTVPNDSAEGDRAWILFQLGNCLRQTDMTRARDMYMKLVSEYPASPWTELAKAHGRLITWYQNARPQQFLETQESNGPNVSAN